MVASNDIKRCHVYLLDDSKLEIPLQTKLLSTELLDIVASHFNLKEKEYFGLYFYDIQENICWLRPDKKALDHEFPKNGPTVLYFGVKNFIDTITILKENKTIELFFLQCRRDVLKGKVECDSQTVFQLAAHVLQATHGDYVSDSIALGDLKNLDVMPVRTLQEHPTLTYCEEQILDEYQKLDGLTKGDAIISYLRIVENLPMYGVHYYEVKDKEQIPWKLGLSHKGVAQYDFHDKNMPRKRFSWSQMENLFYRDKKFTLEYQDSGPRIVRKSSESKTSSNNSLNRLNTIRRSMAQRVKSSVWYASSSSQCRDIWLMAVSQHQFYLDKKQVNRTISGQRCLKEMARTLCKSSTSLFSLRSATSTSNFNDNQSDTASYYYSLDGDSQSSQVLAAEMDMLSALQARKAFLEKQLIEKREHLNELCLREAELTGIVPTELPESPTHPGRPMRRKVGTTFEFDDSVLNTEDYSHLGPEIENMQRDYEIQKQILNAAQRLAKDTSASKKVRKARQISYQNSLVKLKTMEQQLEYMKREVEKDSPDGLPSFNRKDEGGGSIGDSLGPIDGDSSSSKDSLSGPPMETPSEFKKRPRDSMYLATPVVSVSNNSFAYMTERDRYVHSSPSKSSVTSPRYDNTSGDYDNDNYHEYTDNYETQSQHRRRTHSVGNRLHKKPPLPVVKVRAKEFHSSADMLAELANNRPEQYRCSDFESTGMYSVSIPRSKRRTDYGSNPSIPQSYSSPGIAARLRDESPNGLRSLDEMSHDRQHNYPPSYSQVSLGSSSEQSECWSDVLSEETLV